MNWYNNIKWSTATPQEVEANLMEFLSTLEIYTKGATVTNPYSGVETFLSPIALTIYDFIIGMDMLGAPQNKSSLDKMMKHQKLTMNDMANMHLGAKYHFRAKFPHEYKAQVD